MKKKRDKSVTTKIFFDFFFLTEQSIYDIGKNNIAKNSTVNWVSNTILLVQELRNSKNRCRCLQTDR